MTRFRPKFVAEDCVEFDMGSLHEIHQAADQLNALGQFEEVVPGLATLTVRFQPDQQDIGTIIAALESIDVVAPDRSIVPEVIDISVRYGGPDGPDLSDICRHLSISQADLIRCHTGGLYPVEIIGFTPGFAYVGGLSPHLCVPRRPTPRPRLPAGSVGLAGGYTGIYALDGPGGWSIIGRTDHKLFDPTRADPFLIRPGMSVRFLEA